jgi:hypothetical protein
LVVFHAQIQGDQDGLDEMHPILTPIQPPFARLALEISPFLAWNPERGYTGSPARYCVCGCGSKGVVEVTVAEDGLGQSPSAVNAALPCYIQQDTWVTDVLIVDPIRFEERFGQNSAFLIG